MVIFWLGGQLPPLPPASYGHAITFCAVQGTCTWQCFTWRFKVAKAENGSRDSMTFWNRFFVCDIYELVELYEMTDRWNFCSWMNGKVVGYISKTKFVWSHWDIFDQTWEVIINPFTPKSDQCQISSSPVILHHTVRRTWLFIAYLDERWL